MGYLNIDNLYKYPDILLFREVYALEKIHGTSAHVSWKSGALSFFSGGEKHETFVALFDAALGARFAALTHPEVTVFGEAYGGKCQGMSDTYGKSLKFIVFDVKVGDCWLSVPNAEDVAKHLGLEFVHYVKCSTDIGDLNRERDAPSVQSKRNGIEGDKLREGVVLRPLIELTTNNGGRIICKHKRDEFRETATLREVDPEKLKIITEANAIADEWVTPMRLTHVLDKMPVATGIEHTGGVIRAMIEDVKREAAGEIVWSKDAERAIGSATARLYKQRVTSVKVNE
jgi:hypothetical protein